MKATLRPTASERKASETSSLFLVLRNWAGRIFREAADERVEHREGAPFVLGEGGLVGRHTGVVGAHCLDETTGSARPGGDDLDLFVDLGLRGGVDGLRVQDVVAGERYEGAQQGGEAYFHGGECPGDG